MPLASTAATARFCAYAADEAGGPTQVVEATGFAEAAISFAEAWSPTEADGELKVVVTDLESGETHCFCVDVGAGETQPCE